MLDHISHPLSFPKYSKVKHHENRGNWAVKKYYFWPWRFFYRHKVRMIERAIRGDRFNSLMDFGAGPGILTLQWNKYAHEVYSINEGHSQLPNVNMTICSSVMEFVPLKETFEMLSKHTNEIIIASPMKSALSDYYFRLIEDKAVRHSHEQITSEMARYFSINYYKDWGGMYFVARGIKK